MGIADKKSRNTETAENKKLISNGFKNTAEQVKYCYFVRNQMKSVEYHTRH